MKHCPKCGETKPFDAFNGDRSRSDGLAGHCRVCRRRHYNTNAAANDWRKRNPIKAHEQGKRRYARYRLANPLPPKTPAEVQREMKKLSRKAWKERHPERVKEQSHTARGMRRRAPLTDAGREYILILRNDDCCYCGAPSVQVDHIVSIARGGSGDWDNLTAACGPCNRSKGAYPLLSFLLRNPLASV